MYFVHSFQQNLLHSTLYQEIIFCHFDRSLGEKNKTEDQTPLWGYGLTPGLAVRKKGEPPLCNFIKWIIIQDGFLFSGELSVRKKGNCSSKTLINKIYFLFGPFHGILCTCNQLDYIK